MGAVPYASWNQIKDFDVLNCIDAICGVETLFPPDSLYKRSFKDAVFKKYCFMRMMRLNIIMGRLKATTIVKSNILLSLLPVLI
jgi:hypothetical protein